jgi:hypothetical protein
MLADGPYTALAVARLLYRFGDWDAALAVLDGRAGDLDVLELTAQILIDRNFWRLDDPEPARVALAALDPASMASRYLCAQLAYARILFGRDPLPDDTQTAESGFRAATHDKRLRGWGVFWLGALADNVRADPATARVCYDDALALCRKENDLLLESYVVRHLAGHAIELDHDQPAGQLMLRRSLYLRSALGARPQVAAAQVSLASELPAGPERQTLRETASTTALELGLTWLTATLDATEATGLDTA